MGITVQENIILPSGIELTEYYLGTGQNSRITTEKVQPYNSPTYDFKTEGLFFIWKDKSARNKDAQTIGTKMVQVVSSQAPTQGVYELLYAELKKQFTTVDADGNPVYNYTDDIETVPVVNPVVITESEPVA